jgi:hypothetical protein
MTATSAGRQRQRFVGSAEEPKSVKGFEARVAELDTLPELASAKRRERDEPVAEILVAKSKLLDSYRELYQPISDLRLSILWRGKLASFPSMP